MAESFEQRCIISGIGQSEVGRRGTRGVLALTLDASVEAITDAGLTPADIDGVISWPGAVSRAEGLAPSSPGSSGPGVHAVIDALRLNTSWHAAGPETPGMLASVIHGCMAVASGMCRHVLVYRALNEATAWRLNTQRVAADAEGIAGNMQWILPFGAFSGPNWMSLYARRHMHEFGTTREQLAQISLNARRNAALNPKAILTKELSLDEYMSSPIISDPLCLYDCDIAIDGATAVVISHADYAPDAPKTAIHFEAVGSALHGRASWDQWEDMTTTAAMSAGAHLWSRTDLKPADVDCAQLYDGFTVLTLFWLEGLRFCGHGESGAFAGSASPRSTAWARCCAF
ncbi:MAG: thiolase family protein [Solirubrobacteraceae bacterium]